MGCPVEPILSLTLPVCLPLHPLGSLCSVISAASGLVSAISTPRETHGLQANRCLRAPPDLPPSHPTDQGGSLHPAPGHTHPLIKSLPSKDHIWGESNKVVMEVPQGILETRLAGAPGFLEEADELVKGVRGQSTRRVHPKQG